MPIFGDSLEVHLFPQTVPTVLKEQQPRTYYHKEYNIQYVNLEPVCDIDQTCINEVVCGIKLHDFLNRKENTSFEFCVITVKICGKVTTQLLISSEELESGREDFFTTSFKSRTIGKHPIYVTFDGYGSGLRCSPHQVTFRFNMNDQRVDKSYLQLHFVNRFKEIDAPKYGLKRPREEASGNELTYKNAFEQSQRASTSRPHSILHNTTYQNSSNDDYHQRKRARTDGYSNGLSNGYSNGHHSAARHENGHPNNHWPPIVLPSSSSVHMNDANAAREMNDKPHRLRIDLQAVHSHQSAVRDKREPGEDDDRMIGKLKVKEEPSEHTLFYDDSSQPNTSECCTSATSFSSTASAFSEDPSASKISNAVNAALTNVQEDQMDSALVESAVRTAHSTFDQTNVATASARLPSATSTDDTAAGASAEGAFPIASERDHGMGSLKTEETLELYNAIRQEFRLSDMPDFQTSQAQDNQGMLDPQDRGQEALRQAATYSTLLNNLAGPSFSARFSSPSLSQVLQMTMLQPCQNEEPATNNETGGTSTLPDVQQPFDDDQESLSLPAQFANHQVQNVNPRLISPLPQRALRSCMVTEEQRQREKRSVTFNTLVENNCGETWPFEG